MLAREPDVLAPLGPVGLTPVPGLAELEAQPGLEAQPELEVLAAGQLEEGGTMPTQLAPLEDRLAHEPIRCIAGRRHG